jgi:tetratricopeptide (TPR) repeat protein
MTRGFTRALKGIEMKSVRHVARRHRPAFLLLIAAAALAHGAQAQSHSSARMRPHALRAADGESRPVSERRADGTAPVPKKESAQAQLQYAQMLRQAVRGTEGDARSAARKSAIAGYRAVHEYFPGDAAACAEGAFRAGELLRAANENEAALSEFAIARDKGAGTPFRGRGLLEIGHVERRTQKFQEALLAYEAVLSDTATTQRQKDDASLWAGHVYAALKRPDDAHRAWQRVADSAEDPIDRIKAFDCIAQAAIEKGDLDGASALLERCHEAVSEAASEETKLGDRVRNALAGMRAHDELQRAIEKRDRAKSETKKQTGE